MGLRVQGLRLLRRQVAKIDHRLGRALGRQQMQIWLVLGEDLRHGQDLRRQGIDLLWGPERMPMLGARQMLLTEGANGLFHRVERIGRRGQQRELRQFMQVFGQRHSFALHEAGMGLPQLGHLHAVLRQRAGLVHRQHGDRAQGFDRLDAARQDLLLRQAPRAKRQKHREHDRYFLGQHGHGQGNAQKQALQQRPLVPQPTEQHQRQRQCQPGGCQTAHDGARGQLQVRGQHHRRGQRSADAPDLCTRTSRRDARQAHAARHHGAGKQRGGTGLTQHGLLLGLSCQRRLVQRRRLARQQRLVGAELALQQERVGGDAVALMQQQQVAAHHLAAGNAPEHLGLAAGQGVGAVLRQTARRLGIVQAARVLKSPR